MSEIIKHCDNCQAQTVYIGYEPCHSCNRGREGRKGEVMKDNWVASDLYKAESELLRLRGIIGGLAEECPYCKGNLIGNLVAKDDMQQAMDNVQAVEVVKGVEG
jgi:hypothetical protein